MELFSVLIYVKLFASFLLVVVVVLFIGLNEWFVFPFSVPSYCVVGGQWSVIPFHRIVTPFF